jgi:hypothetical protein
MRFFCHFKNRNLITESCCDPAGTLVILTLFKPKGRFLEPALLIGWRRHSASVITVLTPAINALCDAFYSNPVACQLITINNSKLAANPLGTNEFGKISTAGIEVKTARVERLRINQESAS